MEKMKALVADIDGTLVLKGENMLPKTRKALQKLHEQGVQIGLATGRPFDERILEFSDTWKLGFPFDFVIGMNGGDLWDAQTNEMERFYPLKKEDIAEILTFLAPIDHNAIVYHDGYKEVWATRMDEFMEWSQKRNHSHVTIVSPETMASEDTGKLEVHYNIKQHDELMKLIEEHPSDRWQAVLTFMGTIEFQDKRVDKGAALKEYSKKSGIPMEEIIAFGDMDNDIPLLETAGYGVALKNGSEPTKKAADAITEHTVNHDGVGRYLFKHFDLK